MRFTGIRLIAHTFGRNIKFNPHVHTLMTEGGLTPDNRWFDIPLKGFNMATMQRGGAFVADLAS